MKKNITLVIALVCVVLMATGQTAFAKKWTIAQRQAKLVAEINAAYKANQLTLKEANSLKDESTNIRDREQKMKDKNGGKLSYKDDTKLEKNLNDLSNKIHKLVLEKRVQ